MEGRRWRKVEPVCVSASTRCFRGKLFFSCFCCPLLVEWVCQVGITSFDTRFTFLELKKKKKKPSCILLKVRKVAIEGKISCKFYQVKFTLKIL